MAREIFLLDAMTSIRVVGVTILEPITVLTNLLIAFTCFFAYMQLRKQAVPTKSSKLLQFFFMAMGIASVLGGILGHGFLYAVGKYGKIPGWYASMLAVAFFERSAIEHARPLMHPNTAKFFSVFNYLEIAGFMLAALLSLQFRFVEIHATYGLFVVVFCLELFVYAKQKDAGSLYVFAGTFFAALAALTHAYKFGLNEWFTYNDTSHVIMVAAVYCYYLGGANFNFYAAADRRKNTLRFNPQRS